MLKFSLEVKRLSHFPHKCMVCLEGLVREKENIRLISDIFSSTKQSSLEGINRINSTFSGRFALLLLLSRFRRI